MKIVRLQAENVKRIEAVTITPEGPLTVVGGKHEAGKSTTLDCIEYVLSGKKSLPPEPLRRGAKKGRIVLRLSGDKSQGLAPMTVTRTFGENGRTALEIRGDDGYKAPSPQTILDDLYSQIAFDPLAFSRLPPKQQAEAVRELLGLDFAAMDRDRATLYDQRTMVNREAKSLSVQFEAIFKHEGAPAEEVSVADLAKELERRQDVNRTNEDERQRLTQLQADTQSLAKVCDDLRSQIARLQADLAGHDETLTSLKNAVVAAHETVDALEDRDAGVVHTQIAVAESTNQKVRENARRAELTGQYAAKEEESLRLTAQIDVIDADKAAQTAAAKFPVPGMGFGDDGLTFDGLPLEQINMAELIRLSVAMGFAQNPTLPVLLIHEGSLMDVDHLPLIVELAEQHDGQVWMERVGEGAECSVIIEDGHVKGDGDG